MSQLWQNLSNFPNIFENFSCHRGMVAKGLKRQCSYPAVAGSSPPHATMTVVLNSSPEL